jgi:hypothetical protein
MRSFALFVIALIVATQTYAWQEPPTYGERHKPVDQPPTKSAPGFALQKEAPGIAPHEVSVETTGISKSINPNTQEDTPGQGPWMLSVGVLLFALVLSSLLTYLRRTSGVAESLFFKMVGLVLVVSAGLFLIVAGYTQQQIAPMMGLLGTIAGYLLGKGDDPK